jgi:phosphatidylethanolamine/phosphatidyl-N-methylethanolamine N-methyltransferase
VEGTLALNNLVRQFRNRFSDEIRFLSDLKRQPKCVGAIWPTGQIMARRMASVVNPASNLPVLELGPGTGVITHAILERGIEPRLLHAVEYSPSFAGELRLRFPSIHVHQGDAFKLPETLGVHADLRFDCAVSALPLLNFPAAMREKFIRDVLSRLAPGRPLIQFSYGPFAPIPARTGQWSVERYDFVLRNIPPARLWLYRTS